ncbi:MAG: hydroxyethylthiazole kinase, partial [Mycobacteriales bacterium]
SAPLIHCITNIVAAAFSANALLAVGASPAMVENQAESAEFTPMTDALLVNLGMMSAERVEAVRSATDAAQSSGTPWVLDPVAVGVLTERTQLAADLVAKQPTVIRGNASEIMSLAGAAAGGRGVDSTLGSEAAIESAIELARTSGSVVAVSGVTDYVTDGKEVLAVPGGDPLLARITASGCVLGALIAAFGAGGTNPLMAAASASALMAAAGERAAKRAAGPGSFVARLLDDLFALSNHSQGTGR